MDVLSAAGFINKVLRVFIILVIVTMIVPSMESKSFAKSRIKFRHSRASGPCGDLSHSSVSENRPPAYNLSRIKKVLKATMRNFGEKLQDMTNENVRSLVGTDKQKWIPRIKLREVNTNGMNRTSRFQQLLPIFYKQLLKFRIIFEKMQNVKVNLASNVDPKRRKHFIASLQVNLDQLLCEVYQAMFLAKIKHVELTQEESSTEGFKDNIRETTCITQDNAVFKAYHKILRKWKIILGCRTKSKCHSQYIRLFARPPISLPNAHHFRHNNVFQS